MENREFSAAQKLINDYLQTQINDNLSHLKNWKKYILEIALEEKEIPVIRKISFEFIKDNFQLECYKIYKSTLIPKNGKTN